MSKEEPFLANLKTAVADGGENLTKGQPLD